MSRLILLFSDPASTVVSGSFGARLDDAGLHLPDQAYRLAIANDWRDALLFCRAMLDFPEVFRAVLDWTAEEVVRAGDELRALLKEHSPTQVDLAAIQRHAMGLRMS